MDSKEPMLEMFIFETFEMIEQLQQLIIDSEKNKKIETDAINEIFRIMHTIKGSSGMMMFDNIANISHTIEDLFYFIRESKPKKIDYSILTDLVLEGSDLLHRRAGSRDFDTSARHRRRADERHCAHRRQRDFPRRCHRRRRAL